MSKAPGSRLYIPMAVAVKEISMRTLTLLDIHASLFAVFEDYLRAEDES